MANTVTIKVDLDDKGVVTGVKNVKSELQGLGNEAQNAGKKGGDGFTVMKGVLANLATEGINLAVSAVQNFASEVVNVGSTFESSMSKVGALSGATGEDLGRLEEKARELGASTTFSASEAADALGYMALAGWDTEDMLEGVGSVLTLAQAGEMDLAAASDLVTDYLSAFNMTASDTGRMVDVLAYAQSNANTTTQGLGDAFKNCAANANAAGLDIETTTAAISMMANQGLKGAEAGTALNAIMRDMTAKMKDGAIAIGDTSVAVMDADGNYRDFVDILADVEAATNGMGDAEKAAALQSTFTADSIKGLNLLLNAGSDETAKFRDELYNCAGAADATASAMTDNLAGDVAGLESALSELQLVLYDGISPALRSMAQTATESFAAVAESFKNGDIVGGAQAFAQLIMDLLQQILEMLPQMLDIGMQFLAGFIQGFAEAMPSMIPTLVQVVVDLCMVLVENIPLLIEAALQLVTGLAQGLIQAIPVLVAALPQLIQAIVSGLLESVTMIIEAGAQLFVALIQAIPTILPTIVAAIPQIVSSIVSALIEGVPQLIAAAVELFMALVTATPQIIAAVLPMIPQIIMALVEGIISGGAQILESFLSIFGQLPDIISGPLEFIGGLFDTIFGGIMAVVGPILDAIGQGISWLGEQFSWLSGPIEAIGGAFDWLGGAIGGAWDFITGKSDEGSQQVSQDMSNMQSSTETAMSSMESSTQSAWSQMSSTTSSNLNNMKSDTSSAFSSMQSDTSSKLSSMNSDLSSKYSSMSSTVDSNMSKMQSTTSSKMNDMQSTTSSTMSSMQSSMSSSMSSMQSNTSSTMSSMQSQVSSSFSNMASASNTSFSGISSDAQKEMMQAQLAVTNELNTATQNLQNSVNSMVQAMSQGVNQITSTWNNARFSTPHIPLPHFSVSGRLDPNVPSVPSFSVNWYAKGGLFNGPSIIGVGEAGPEAVVPLNKKGLEPIADAVSQKIDAGVTVQVHIENFVNQTGQSIEELMDIIERKLEERIARKRRRLGLQA